jgi:hypothetical protein
MPNIFDNINQHLLPALRATLANQATGIDISVGYFNLRGWNGLADYVEQLSGADDSCCRLLVGMQRPPPSAPRLPRWRSSAWMQRGRGRR